MDQTTTQLETPARTYTVLSPQWNGRITIAPLVRNRPPRSDYVSLGTAIERGLELTEVGEAGIVGEIVARAPGPEMTLLLDGEELVGAKQDRILAVSVLLAGESETRIPVSCVEQGRWSRRTPAFELSPRAASPSLRKAKAESIGTVPRAHGRAQASVWSGVAASMAHHGLESATGRYGDLAEARGSEIADLTSGFELVPGQCGVAVAIGGQVVAIDAVSRADVFASLWSRLLAGYGLDALSAPAAERVPRRRFVRVLADIDRVPLARNPSVSLGEDLRGVASETTVSGLSLDGELIQLSAYRAAA